MPNEALNSDKSMNHVRTLRLKVKTEAYAWLNAAATEVNVCWNYANEVSAPSRHVLSRAPPLVERL